MLAMYMPLILTVLGVAGYKLRTWTPATGFWHSNYGHAVITLSAGFVAAGASWLQSGNLSEQTAIMAAVGAMSAWLGALKPAGSAS